MNSLYDYLSKKDMKVDGHIHLFNYKEPISLSLLPYEKFVGFMDIEFDKKANYLDRYEDFIKVNYNDKYILLATALDIEDIKNIYNKYKGVIKGFGELKCYDFYKNQPVPYKRIKLPRQVCKFSSEVGNLPVYIHWEINEEKDLKRIENLIKDYPMVPIVLCHCGMNDYNKSYAYHAISKLMRTYSNVWVDCTYTAQNYFIENPMKLLNLPTDRLILGSDINNKNFGIHHNPEKEVTDIVKNNNKLLQYIDSDRNIKTLFKL